MPTRSMECVKIIKKGVGEYRTLMICNGAIYTGMVRNEVGKVDWGPVHVGV